MSFESRSNPGSFLRHSGYRIQLNPNDNTAVFAADATFCVREGLSGAGTSLESKNLPGRYLRHINSEVFIANNSGANPWDNPANFAADATWALAQPASPTATCGTATASASPRWSTPPAPRA